MVYNRPLSDDEIYSNYLIQARRYGLPEIAKPYTVDSSVYVYSQAAGITDTVTLNALNTFVQGLKSASLWDKMVAIYPFIGTNPSSSRLNLKDVSLNTTQVNYSGSWSTSLSGSRNNNTSSFGVLSNITPSYVHPLINSQSFHMTYLSYDTPVSGGYAMGATTQVIATGGQVFDISGSRVHVFTASANFTVTQGGTVQALVVAGGGGGGGDIAGGGGAGGLIFTSLFATSSTYSVNVGGGGSGGSGGSATTGNNGGTSSFAGNVTLGGGGGGGFARSGSNGGSGGGHGVSSTTFGLGTAGQGNNGALATTPGGSGGGGASTSGSNITGGSGSFFPQYVGTGFGSPAGWFAGGGGGAPTDYNTLDGGLGGIGGGGQAGRRPVYNPTTGSTNTGGGGGGGSSNQNGGTGGSGIIIISYPISGSTTLYIDPTSISASINDTSTNNLVTGGPIGMITVSRTGSVGTILTKNKVPTIGTSRVSSSINLNLYLNGLNASNALVSASQNTVLYTSVGGGLTIPEILTHNTLVSKLQYDLGRGLLLEGFSAEAAYSVRRLSRTSQFAMDVRRDLDDTTGSIGFDTNGNLDTGSLLAFVTGSAGTGSGFVARWYDQSGNNNHATQTTSSNQPLIVNSGSLITQGSRVSLNFDSNFFNLSSRVTLNDFTTFWVARRATGATNRSILLVGDNDNHYAGDYVDGRGTPYFNSTTAGQFISTVTGNTVNITGTAFHLAYANRRGNQAVGQYNGSTTSNYATVSTSPFFIDNIANYSSIPSYRYSGSVSEIIIHGSDQSSNRTTIESNINSYFNIY
jgi:hypothetical protein